MRLKYQESGVKASVALFLDNSTKTQVKAFHCGSCGYVVFQYYSDPIIMVAGTGPLDKTISPVAIVQCSNNQCKAKYEIYR